MLYVTIVELCSTSPTRSLAVESVRKDAAGMQYIYIALFIMCSFNITSISSRYKINYSSI